MLWLFFPRCALCPQAWREPLLNVLILLSECWMWMPLNVLHKFDIDFFFLIKHLTSGHMPTTAPGGRFTQGPVKRKINVNFSTFKFFPLIWKKIKIQFIYTDNYFIPSFFNIIIQFYMFWHTQICSKNHFKNDLVTLLNHRRSSNKESCCLTD